ncbi:ABC transporter ATP-binding protein [Bacillus spizizenii]|uniref:ABC transporter ATP-binding protein n=1 Tax=Bacillus spizizenii TaxID=96241 RepID=UPI0007728D1A|nr:ABC transporter ATP-binding protein [Bacillus spizizenii]SCV41527.1 ABC-type MDR transporter, ATPase component [Bacillus subtilis]KXJ38900.1 antibiotic ABC transporter ATP-binding protein [Bacillus spizizenii]MEC1436996.1 ABC transporter ATP-binding protein [Bacillus spizizenii]MED0870555.1 ABC transporter ATP-binding protein [Bacillus spizizenii]MED1070856.1 ABC transporter ATP-binding protein [Bacillus spizizenii]
MNNVAAVKDLKMQYGNKMAVDGISFEVREGEVLGLLGPNGAGKSTTIHMLSGELSASSGNVTILGHNVKKWSKEMKKGIGIVPQDIAIYEEISAEKNVRFFASLYSLKGEELKTRVKEALELVQLYDRKDDKPKTFSGGMKRRLNIACAIAHQPKLIIMDEPTVGIDPQSRHHILVSIKELKTRGASIIYSTHYMEEAEAISDRIIIMNEGKIIANGTKEELYREVNKEMTYAFQLTHAQQLNKNSIRGVKGVTGVDFSDRQLKVTVRQNQDHLSEIIAELGAQGCGILSMNKKEASLETVFLELTGRNLRD